MDSPFFYVPPGSVKRLPFRWHRVCRLRGPKHWTRKRHFYIIWVPLLLHVNMYKRERRKKNYERRGPAVSNFMEVMKRGGSLCVCVLTDLRVVWHTTRVPSKNFCPSLPFPLGPARKESKKKRVMTPRSAPTSAATTWAHSTGTTGHPYLRNKIVIRQTLLPLSIMTLKKWNINSVSMHPQTHNLRFWILWRFFFQSFFVVATGCLLLMEMSV